MSNISKSLKSIYLIFLRYMGGENKVAKKGEQYKCNECGLVVVVQEPCDCIPCNLICCETTTAPVKATAKATPAKPVLSKKK